MKTAKFSRFPCGVRVKIRLSFWSRSRFSQTRHLRRLDTHFRVGSRTKASFFRRNWLRMRECTLPTRVRFYPTIDARYFRGVFLSLRLRRNVLRLGSIPRRESRRQRAARVRRGRIPTTRVQVQSQKRMGLTRLPQINR